MVALTQFAGKRFLFLLGAVLLGCLCVGKAQESIQLAPPEGEKLVLQAHAKGDQIYTCKKTSDQYAWTLKEPRADLFDEQNKLIGHHFAGPTWELNDGSQVVGKVVTKIDSANSIPWLSLAAASHSGNGALSSVTSIQRVHTTGGKAAITGCDAAHENNESRVGYTADYFFYAKP
jgi:hypothetical protein